MILEKIKHLDIILSLIYILSVIAMIIAMIIVQIRMFSNKASAVTYVTTSQTSSLPIRSYPRIAETYDMNLTASTISVSSVKITWRTIKNHQYYVSCTCAEYESTTYKDNIRIKRKNDGYYYITGLRENSRYIVTVKDATANIEAKCIAQTENVKILEEYDYIPGKTNCFTFESADGLTLDPSKSAIAGSISDPVTDTGIMRNKYGDYCAAMGLYYGECGDRFLIELENGTQFTVKICDSKGLADDGDGKYHIFGEDMSGKSIVEFIHGPDLPTCVDNSGNYGDYDWDGLIFDNIKSISRVAYGNSITY